MGKVKLIIMNFRYVIAVDVTLMHTNFQTKLQISLKLVVQLLS